MMPIVRRTLTLLLLLGVVSTAYAQPDTIPPPIPGTPFVTLKSTSSTGATFSVTWAASIDQPSNTPVPTYTYTAADNDGQASTSGSTNTNSLTLAMPYHTSGLAQSAFICIKAVDAAGNVSVDQSCNSFTVPAPSPSASVQAVLTWQDNSNNEDLFNVERKPDICTAATAFAEIATVPTNITAYTDRAVQIGRSYCYRVAASNTAGKSNYSNMVGITIAAPPPVLPANPTNLILTPGP